MIRLTVALIRAALWACLGALVVSALLVAATIALGAWGISWAVRRASSS